MHWYYLCVPRSMYVCMYVCLCEVYDVYVSIKSGSNILSAIGARACGECMYNSLVL